MPMIILKMSIRTFLKIWKLCMNIINIVNFMLRLMDKKVPKENYDFQMFISRSLLKIMFIHPWINLVIFYIYFSMTIQLI